MKRKVLTWLQGIMKKGIYRAKKGIILLVFYG